MQSVPFSRTMAAFASTMENIILAGLLWLVIIWLPLIPSIKLSTDINVQTPLRIYAREGELLGEFGAQQRIPVTLEAIPAPLIQAFLAAEDDQFYRHHGIDFNGLIRAALLFLATGEKRQGGSTITMQLARNLFLSSEKSFERKLKEIGIALRMEQELDKERILELYLNQIYFGQGAWGIGAAASIYYDAKPRDLTIAQMTMLAGLPKAPSAFNPITNPEGALHRRSYVIRRLYQLNLITHHQYQEAMAAPITAIYHSRPLDVHAPYAAETIRRQIFRQYEEGSYQLGISVTTTIDARLQSLARKALQNGLIQYTIDNIPIKSLGHIKLPTTRGSILKRLDQHPHSGPLIPSMIIKLTPSLLQLMTDEGERISIEARALQPILRTAGTKSPVGLLHPGDIVYAWPKGDKNWTLVPEVKVQGALVALDPRNGEILAMSGGFDFAQSNFNRAIQAKRQLGSVIKPLYYSAALEHRFTPASILWDIPLRYASGNPSKKNWRPGNYANRYYGPTRMREALAHSRNLASIQLVDSIGVRQVRNYITRFGLNKDDLTPDLSIALGTNILTPLELGRAYATFANGGYLVQTTMIRSIDIHGNTIYKNPIQEYCVSECEPQDIGAPRIISQRNAFIMDSMLKDVIRKGSGRRARTLKRSDIAGKTGTTNDFRDGWFCGYHPDLLTVVFIGHDNNHTLGKGNSGSRTALPIWIEFMGQALKNLPFKLPSMPSGIVTSRINPDTGLRLGSTQPKGGLVEYFYTENLPKLDTDQNPDTFVPDFDEIF